MFLLSPACLFHILMQQQYDYVFIFDVNHWCPFFIAEPKPTLELSDLESHRSWSSFLKGIVHTKNYILALMSFS